MAFEFKVNAVWRIEKETFDRNIAYRIISKNIETSVDDFKYYFIISEGGDSIAISIDDGQEMENTKVKELTVTISSADYKGDLSTAAEVPEGSFFHGYKNAVVIKRQDFMNPENKFFKNNILEVEFRGILQFDRKPFIPSIGTLLWNGDDKDFTLDIDKQLIKVHKCVLRRLSSDFARRLDAGVDHVEINDFLYSVVLEIGFCYELSIESTVQSLLECVRFTNVYDMPLVKKRVEQELCQKIDADNVCHLANKSIELNCPTLKGCCINFISKFSNANCVLRGIETLSAEMITKATAITLGNVL